MKYLQYRWIFALCHLHLLNRSLALSFPGSGGSRPAVPFYKHASHKTSLEAIKKKMPATAAVTATAASAITTSLFPSTKLLIMTNLLPTCIGFYKYEYGVSYAYGMATATTAYLTLQSLVSAPVTTAFVTAAQIHAAAIVFYGVRLNSFLFYREFFNKRFRLMRERIEQRQIDKEKDTGWIGRFLNRAPFVLSCSMLYAGLAAPLLVSAKIIEIGASPTCNMALNVYKGLVGLTWFGFSLGALGDYTKSIIKAKKGPDHLVTGGVYRFFRHPNYTGEVMGWTASFLASLVAMVTSSGAKGKTLKVLLPWFGLSSLGAVGIIFVLLAAATNLEKRQEEKYGRMEEYERWIKSSWSGPTLPLDKKTKNSL